LYNRLKVTPAPCNILCIQHTTGKAAPHNKSYDIPVTVRKTRGSARRRWAFTKCCSFVPKH